MGRLSVLAFKEIIKETGARASDEAARELASAAEELARKLAERARILAFHAERKTVKAKDVKQALRELSAG